MPITSGKMNARERAICARLRQIRVERLRHSQPDFARALQVTQNQLAAYEYQHVPVRYRVGARLCEAFKLSQLWLACGEGPEQPSVAVPLDLEVRIGPRMLFSEAYDQVLHAYVLNRINEVERARAAGQALASTGAAKGNSSHFTDILGRVWFEQVPAERWPELFGRMMEAGALFAQECGGVTGITTASDSAGFNPERKFQSALESSPASADTPGVQRISESTWERLRQQLAALTTAYGAKSKLAREFGVSPQLAGAWLSGASAPNADTTLRLLAWAAAEERRQASRPGTVKTRPAARPTKRKARNGRRRGRGCGRGCH